MAVRLTPMTEQDYPRWLEEAVRHYAGELASTGYFKDPDAMAAEQFRQLLPEGLATPGHHIYHIRNENDVPVGVIWIGERPEVRMGFIYSLDVMPEHRRRGYARGGMLAAEEEVQRLGLTSLGLNVFGQNAPAISLYQSLGYRVTNFNMKKDLAQPEP